MSQRNTYERDGNCIYIDLDPINRKGEDKIGMIASTIPVTGFGVVVDLDGDGNIVGVELVNANNEVVEAFSKDSRFRDITGSRPASEAMDGRRGRE